MGGRPKARPVRYAIADPTALKKLSRPLSDWVTYFLSDREDPDEPHFDPVHLGGSIVVTLTALGCVYWLLWTLLVYEGGIILKLYALARLASGTSLRDLGWEGYPYAMGDFEGVFGNFLALVFCIVLAAAIRRLYLLAARKRKRA